jgi:hypothetical protein
MLGAIASLAFSLPAFSDFVLDDLEDGNGENKLGRYWYTYQTYSPKISLTPAEGADFTPAAGGYNSSLYAAAMAFSGLDGGTGYPEIVMATDVSASETAGIGASFNDVDSIVFWAKGPSGLKFHFNVHTEEGASNSGYYTTPAITVSGNNAWARYSYSLKPVTAVAAADVGKDLSDVGSPTGKAGGLTQAAYYGKAFTFVPSKVTALSWAIKKDENTSGGTTSPASGTFAVDDITFKGAFTPPATTTPPGTTPPGTTPSDNFGAPPPSVLLADFTASKNALGQYGYSYKNTGSTITEGSVGREGNGLSAEFTVAGAADARFAGLGINLADEDMASPLDATGFTGIYFEYKTGGITSMRLEAVDKAAAQRNDGTVYQISLPAASDWKAATVNFSQLALPTWATASPAFNKNSLVKLQFATTDAGSGSIAIDNVYFLGATSFPGQSSGGGTAAKYALTYKVNTEYGGFVSVNGENHFTRTDSVAANAYGPSVTAIPSPAYRFVNWAEDGNTGLTRSDVATGNLTFTAVFEPRYTITYTAGEGGALLVEGETALKTEHKVTLDPGVPGPTVTAIGGIDPPTRFARWSDGGATQSRSDKVVDGNLTFTAEFEENSAPPVYVKVTYVADEGGSLRVGAAAVPALADSLTPGGSFTVTAVPGDGYTFFRWSDNVTSPTRTDGYDGGAVNVTAHFAPVPVDPGANNFVFAYSAGNGGKIREGTGGLTSSITRSVAVGNSGPLVTAVPDAGYSFVKWSDGLTDAARTDTATANRMVSAEFALDGIENKTFALSYMAGVGGKLSVGGDYSMFSESYDTTVAAGANAPVITAIADAGYVFLRWSDGLTEDVQRIDRNVQAAISVTAEFKQREVAVASPNREIPSAAVTEVSVVTPVAVIAGEFAAGPNPAAAAVNFFRTGRATKGGKLSVYDASGNLVATIKLSDKGSGNRRVVGTWNLKDSKGREAANGSYAVRGYVTAKDGAMERVSAIIAVAR